MATDILVHGAAVAVAVDPDGPLAGALLLAPSGYGKSGLALALIETCPWRRTALIADDAVLISAGAGGLVARAPQSIAGLIEIRGFGPAAVRRVGAARLLAGFDLAAPASRLPDPEMRAFAEGLALPVWPFQGGETAACRLRAALRSILGGQTW
jgi:hypothetical protein